MVDLRLNSLKIRKVRILEKFCNQCQKLTQKTKFRFFCPRNFRRIAKLNSKFLKIIPIMETIFFSNSSFKTIFSTLRCISSKFSLCIIFGQKWSKMAKNGRKMKKNEMIPMNGIIRQFWTSKVDLTEQMSHNGR